MSPRDIAKAHSPKCVSAELWSLSSTLPTHPSFQSLISLSGHPTVPNLIRKSRDLPNCMSCCFSSKHIPLSQCAVRLAACLSTSIPFAPTFLSFSVATTMPERYCRSSGASRLHLQLAQESKLRSGGGWRLAHQTGGTHPSGLPLSVARFPSTATPETLKTVTLAHFQRRHFALNHF